MANNNKVAYDEVAFRDFCTAMCKTRRAQEGAVIPQLTIDQKGLKEAIWSLNSQDREIIEKFWGLTGGINFSKKPIRNNDIALKNMKERALHAIRKIYYSMDSMFMYDLQFQNLVENIGRKVKKPEWVDNFWACKYVLTFCVIFLNGPKVLYDSDFTSLDDKDKDPIFDEYAVLEDFFEITKDLAEGSISFKLMEHIMSMLDIKDRQTIENSRFMQRGSPKGKKSKKERPLETLKEIREFKEKLFPYGPWCATECFILGYHKRGGSEEFQTFMEEVNNIWLNNWNIETYKTDKIIRIRTTQGECVLPIYNVGGYEVTDIREIMVLHLAAHFME